MLIDVGYPGPGQWLEAIEQSGALWVRADEYQKLVGKLHTLTSEAQASNYDLVHTVMDLERRLKECEQERDDGLSRIGEMATKVRDANEKRALDREYAVQQQALRIETEARLDAALGLLREVAASGIVLTDQRISYVEVQLDADLVERIQAMIVETRRPIRVPLGDADDRCSICGAAWNEFHDPVAHKS